VPEPVAAAAALEVAEAAARGDTWLLRELASDHAGESGAVQIYRGAELGLLVRGEPLSAAVRAREHARTEAAHLAMVERLAASPASRTALVPLWRVAGFGLGLGPALVGGEEWVNRTTSAVESFVCQHYLAQVEGLEAGGAAPALKQCLAAAMADEDAHRRGADEEVAAAEAAGGGASPLYEATAAAWEVAVRVGSAAAAEVARRV